jgi:hypothetical protein
MVQDLLDETIITINFHAGITQTILEEKLKEIFTNLALLKKDEKSRVWIFLDEINTCDCLGMVSELMIKRTLNGRSIDESLIFVAACNPFRLKNKVSMQIGLKSKKDRGTLRLAYTVKPLPISLMNFVFDFGSLRDDDEKRYIECMLNAINLRDYEHQQLCLDCLVVSQSFIKQKEESSSVSLRDIKRFTISYSWFKNMITKRRESLDSDWIAKRSLILSLFMGYYFKLNSRTDREEYLNEIYRVIKKSDRYIYQEYLKQIYDQEVNYYLDSMEIPEGIARNESLKENIFVLLVSICNGIPVIISGKPGCSKTLSVNLIQDNMNGKNSKSEFLRMLPRVYFKCYQGSLSSTSEEIEKVFESAYKKNREVLNRFDGKKVEDQSSLIKIDERKSLVEARATSSYQEEDVKIIVFFDELGLAEISPNNPLKVLHGLLEPDVNDLEKHVGFIGISNWRLGFIIKKLLKYSKLKHLF